MELLATDKETSVATSRTLVVPTRWTSAPRAGRISMKIFMETPVFPRAYKSFWLRAVAVVASLKAYLLLLGKHFAAKMICLRPHTSHRARGTVMGTVGI